MKSTKPQISSRRSWVLVPVAGIVVLAVVFATAQLLPVLERGSNIITKNNPLVPQPLSAITIEGHSKEFKANLKNVAFITNTTSISKGPLYEACSTGVMGPQPGGEVTTYAFMAKESGAEAFYQVKQAADGTSTSTAYYSANGTQLSEVVSSMIGYSFSLDEGYYVAVDDKGNILPDGLKFSARKEGNKYVYKVNLVARGEGDRCDGAMKLSRYTIDASSFAILRVEQYKGSADEANRIYTYKEDIALEQLSESQAIQRMSKAGFDKATALSTFPAYIP